MQFVHESTLSYGYQNPRCPFWIIWRWNFDFQSMGAKHLYDVNFNAWSNKWFFQEFMHKLWIVGLLAEVCVLGILGWDLQNRRPRQVWSCSSTQPIPSTRTKRVRKPLWIEQSRTVIRSLECFSLTLICVSLFTDSPFLKIISCPFSSVLRPNCSHQFETAPEILSWFTEWMIPNKSSVFEALKCMVFFSFQHSQNFTTLSNGTCKDWLTCFLESLYHLWSYGISLSFKFIFARTEKNVQCPCEKFFAYVLTFS